MVRDVVIEIEKTLPLLLLLLSLAVKQSGLLFVAIAFDECEYFLVVDFMLFMTIDDETATRAEDRFAIKAAALL